MVTSTQFQFHTVLYSLVARHNNFAMSAGDVTLGGAHEAGAISLRALMLMKRVVGRFLARLRGRKDEKGVRFVRALRAASMTGTPLMSGREKTTGEEEAWGGVGGGGGP